MYYYEVAPLKVVRATAHVFTYQYDAFLPVGAFVTIPVGNKVLTGLIVRQVQQPSFETKSVVSTIETIPALPAALVHTSLWLAEYYDTHLAVVLQTVLPAGLTKKRRVIARPPQSFVRERTNFVLNTQQSHALKSLTSLSTGTAILHGVTGSGKTAVYIEYAKYVISTGRSLIVLVPEIALTSQLVAEFQQHFEDIILTHSRQSEAERHLVWLAAANATTPQVVIGPRSSLFMPLSHIGAIIIDEAHEPSYKQDKSPRYSALRVASVLARQHGAVVVQGTATPLVAEYYLAEQTHSPILELHDKARSDTVAPEITLVDMTKRDNFHRHKIFSDTLIEQMTNTLEAGNQVLLFHNRRGSASISLCDQCGWSAICPHCFVPLTLHADKHMLQCHICGTGGHVPTSCPECASTDIIHKGLGTKRIESEIRALFPNKKIMRFDGDSETESTLDRQYQSLYDGVVDIIIGTQVIAKGLDLPHLRLVGVIQADAGLSMPDYTSAERTFQLLAQVVGRVGRSLHPTSVIVQSYQPNHLAVRTGIHQDFKTFYHDTLTERKRALFPPYVYLLKLTCIYKTEAAVIRNTKKIADKLRKKHPDVTLLGPVPAFYERQRDTYRWQIVVKSPVRARLLEISQDVPTAHWQVDLDPQSLI